jgi:hypothetical protein
VLSTYPELTALAGVLRCSPAELIGRPRTLREHRIARGLAPEGVARAVGHEFPAYTRMEERAGSGTARTGSPPRWPSCSASRCPT